MNALNLVRRVAGLLWLASAIVLLTMMMAALAHAQTTPWTSVECRDDADVVRFATSSLTDLEGIRVRIGDSYVRTVSDEGDVTRFALGTWHCVATRG